MPPDLISDRDSYRFARNLVTDLRQHAVYVSAATDGHPTPPRA